MRAPLVLERLHVSGLSCWRPPLGEDVVTIPLAPVQAIIGGNESGKSSLVDAIRMLALGESPRGRTVDDIMSHASGDRIVLHAEFSDDSWARREWARDSRGVVSARGTECSWVKGSIEQVASAIRARLGSRPKGVRDQDVIDHWAPRSLIESGPALRRRLLARFGGAEGWTPAELMRDGQRELDTLPPEVQPRPPERDARANVLDSGEAMAIDWIRGAEARVRRAKRDVDERLASARVRAEVIPQRAYRAEAERELEQARAEVMRLDRQLAVERRAHEAAAKGRARRKAIETELASLPLVEIGAVEQALAEARQVEQLARYHAADLLERERAQRDLDAAEPTPPTTDRDALQRQILELENSPDYCPPATLPESTKRWAALQGSGLRCPACDTDLAAHADEAEETRKAHDEQVRHWRDVARTRERLASELDAAVRAYAQHCRAADEWRGRVQAARERLARPAVPRPVVVDVRSLKAQAEVHSKRQRLEGELAGLPAAPTSNLEDLAAALEDARAIAAAASKKRDEQLHQEQRVLDYEQARAEVTDLEASSRHLTGWLTFLARKGQALLGEVARQISPASEICGRPVALSLDDDARGNPSCVILVDGVALVGCSDGAQIEVLAGVTAATLTSADGWRILLVDRIEGVSRARRAAFVARLVEAHRRGLVDQVILAGCPDAWDHVSGCDVLDLDLDVGAAEAA